MIFIAAVFAAFIYIFRITLIVIVYTIYFTVRVVAWLVMLLVVWIADRHRIAKGQG